MYESEEELVLQSRYGLLHYAYLIRRTGPVISLISLSNLAMSLITYGAPCITLLVLLSSLLCYIYDATFILTLGYPLFTNTYVS